MIKTLLFISKKYWLGNKLLLLQLYTVIVLAAAGLFCACLYGRSSILAELEAMLNEDGNCDVGVYYPDKEMAAYLEADTRFTESSKVYRTGSISPAGKKDLSAGVGYFENELAIDMFHLPLLEGRYPEREGELCADKRTLQSWGYAARTGEKISLCLYDESGSFVEEREYLLTGILKIQDTNGYRTYVQRSCAANWWKLDDVVLPPLFYLSKNEGEQLAGTAESPFIFLADIDLNGDYDYYDILTDLQKNFGEEIYFGGVSGRFATGQFLVTRGNGPGGGKLSSKWYESVTADEKYRTLNFYNAFLIPCFTVLLILLTVCSIYSVLHLMLQKRSVQLGTLRAVGMSMGQVAAMLLLEAFLFLASGVAAGYLLGAGIYALSLKLQEVLFGQKVFYAFFLDSFWGRYIKMVTYSPAGLPWMVTALTVAAVMLFYFAGHIHDRPLDMLKQGKARIRRKRRGRSLGASLVGGRHMGLLLLLTLVTGAVSFGYFSCRWQAQKEADDVQRSLTALGLKADEENTYEYYARISMSNTIAGYYDQTMHEAGLDAAVAMALAESGDVEDYFLSAENISSRLVYERDGEKDAFLSGGSNDYWDPDDTYYVERHRMCWEYMGFPADQEVYQAPTIALAQENLSLLTPYVVRGEIHPDKLASGEEVILLAKEEAVCDYFTVGEMLPLADVVYDKEIDEDTGFQAGIVPEGALPAFYQGTEPVYEFGKRKDFPSRVGAIAVLDEAGQKLFYSSLPVRDSGVRIASTLSALEAFGLPDHNYTNFYVNLKKDGDRAAFEGKWYSLLAASDLMNGYCLGDIKRDMDAVSRSSMMIFYSLFILLLLIGSVSICNLITVMLYNGRKKTAIVRAVGGSAGRIRGMILKRLLCYPLLAGGIGALLLYGYTGLAWYARHLREEENLPIVNGQYPPEWYWHFPRQYFWCYPLHRFLIGFTALTAAALLLFAVKRLTALLRGEIPEESDE